ncbi:MAG TPA: hypothetical protein VGG51_01140 [Candidatus Cybelea sp.]|jgi:hypothetical protein
MRRFKRRQPRFGALTTLAESVWMPLREIATAYARRKRPISMPDARMLVVLTCREKKVPRPRPDALERLASELVRLTREAVEPPTYGIT